MDKRRRSVNRFSKNRREPVAERDAVEHRACGCEENRVRACASGAGAQSQQKQTREHDQREEQIQRRPTENAAFCARRTQRVEHEPERKAQRERERREHRLIRY